MMTDQSPQPLTDAELASFVAGANAMHQMEAELEADISVLLARPFDTSAQTKVRELLESDRMRQATGIAQGLAHQPRGEG